MSQSYLARTRAYFVHLNWSRSCIAFLVFLIAQLVLPVQAQEVEENADGDASAEEIQAYMAWAEEFESNLDRRHGEISLLGKKVILNVPTNFYYLDKKDTRAVLEEAWGNPPDDDVLGMLFPQNYSPLDDVTWGVLVYWTGDGYVSDEDAQDADYDALLKQLKKETEESNAYREEQGYARVELIGWAEAPYYDQYNNRIYWAKEFAFEGAEDHTLNYDMRILGRYGVLTLSYVAGMDQLDEVRASRDEVLNIAHFTSGNQYADYEPGDKKADYGVAALVAGGAGLLIAKKAGLFGILLLFLKKGFAFILIAFGAIATKFRSMFGGKKD